MSSRRNQLRSAAARASSSSLRSIPQCSSATRPSSRRHFILVLVDVPDKSSLFANLPQLLPARSVVGIGCSWCCSDRIKLSGASNTLEDASKSITTLLEQMDRSTSVDIILILGNGELPSPDNALDLFSILDSALNERTYDAMVRIVCLENARLNNWDVLLGASVIRLSTLGEINSSCFDDKNVVFRGSLILAGDRTISGITLTLKHDCKLADAKKFFSCNGGLQQMKVLARVRLDSVPVILFRKSFLGEMHWNASRCVGHRMLSYWLRGRGIMDDDHGVFMQIIGGPIILLFSSNNSLCYRTVISTDDESKMVAVKQALSHSDRYACSNRIP